MNISEKVIKCALCGEDIVIKTFRLATYKRTAKGCICKNCADSEAAAKKETGK